jgi:SAM-dependent methyltransferase
MGLQQHWDKVFAKNPLEKLGWYETDLSSTLRLIDQAHLAKESRILNVGAGSTTLVDELLERGYSNVLATDISEVALRKIDQRVGRDRVEIIVDDLTNPGTLNTIEPVDIWIDRAVLHFFTDESDQEAYFLLLNKVLKPNGYVLLAQFNVQGAEKCSGLPIHRYSKEMLQEKLGPYFKLIDSFEYTYTMPSGDSRPYIYTLFQKTGAKPTI